MQWRMCPERRHGVYTVVGGVLIHLTLGNLYSFGNMMTYMVSYMHTFVNTNINYANMVWVNAFTTGAQGLFMVLGGILEKKVGPRLTCLSGCIILSGGIALTYYAIDVSLPAVMMTYGALAGLGISLSYVTPLACAMMWFPHHKGLINGFIVAGFGLGSLGSTTFQTLYLNPDNISVGKSGYFEDVDILNRTPNIFPLMALIFFCLQVVGVVLLNKPNTSKESHRQEVEHLLIDEDDLDTAVDQERVVETPALPKTDLKTTELFYEREFYILWCIYLFNTTAIGYINAMYKSYGQTFISSDFFLSHVGSFAAIFNACGRLIWGRLMDKTSFKFSMKILAIGLSILFATLPLSKYCNEFVFALWIWLIFLFFSGTFVLMPTVTEKAFGGEHYTANYGLLFTSQVVSGPLVAGVNQLMLHTVGYTGCFIVIAVVVSFSGLLTMLIRREL